MAFSSCEVFLLRPAEALETAWLPMLSADERARHRAFHQRPDQIAFACAHGLTRLALAKACPETSPESWRFGVSSRGKPTVNRLNLAFNLSHARELVAVAITDGAEVGVDVEPINTSLVTDDLMRTVYAKEEITDIARHGLERFFTYWVLKESWVKATGEGLDEDLPRLCFQATADGRASIVRGDTRPWAFSWWRALPMVMAGVCVSQPDTHIETVWW
jgi:4'-phosphopantetheinyl transferase